MTISIRLILRKTKNYLNISLANSRGKNIFIDIDQSFSPTTIQGKQYVVVNDHEEREMKPSNIALFEVDTLGGKVTYRPITWDEVKNTPGHGDILEQIEKAKKTSLEGKVQEH